MTPTLPRFGVSGHAAAVHSVVWGETRTLSWEVQAVNSGSFAVYVVVLPFGATTVAAEKLVASPMVKTRGRAAIHAESIRRQKEFLARQKGG